MIAVIPIQVGHVPPGGDECVAEAGGRCLLIGSGVEEAVDALAGVASEVDLCEAGPFAPLAWAKVLPEVLPRDESVLVPASVEGRALAPHLAAALGLSLVGPTDRPPDSTSVVMLQPGSRSVNPSSGSGRAEVTAVELLVDSSLDARLVEVQAADPATVDLAAARRIVAGGAGLNSPDDLAQLGELGLSIGASLGATRVLTDAGWLGHERQIGTTGVEVNPDLYIAVGVSGAVQHIMGIGKPDRVISVNTDASCPMMGRADLALVTDGPGFVTELAQLLAGEMGDGA